VAPPELARNAPVADVFHPVQVDFLLVLGNDRNQPFAHHANGRLGQRFHPAEPLGRNPRLDVGFAAVANPDGVGVIGYFFEQPLFFQVFDDPLARLEAAKPRVGTRVLVHPAVIGHDVDFRQMMPPAEFKVVRVVRRSDLHRPRPEFAVDKLVGNDRNLAVHQRQAQYLPGQRPVPLIVGMNGDGRIAQKGFRPRGGHDDVFISPGSLGVLGSLGQRIADVPQLSPALLVHHLQVAQRRLAARAPVHHVAPAVDQPFAIEPQERFEYGPVQRRIERESLARPVAAVAQANHLLADSPARSLLPLPDAPLEFLSPQVLPFESLLGQLPLDHHLRGDSGVIGPR